MIDTRSTLHRRQAGITLIGLLFWLVVFGSLVIVGLKVFPTVNEYLTIKQAVQKAATTGGSTVPEIRAAFERQKQIEYSIQSIGGNDLDITKEGDKVVVRFAYDKEIELIDPVYLVIKYKGESK